MTLSSRTEELSNSDRLFGNLGADTFDFTDMPARAARHRARPITSGTSRMPRSDRVNINAHWRCAIQYTEVQGDTSVTSVTDSYNIRKYSQRSSQPAPACLALGPARATLCSLPGRPTVTCWSTRITAAHFRSGLVTTLLSSTASTVQLSSDLATSSNGRHSASSKAAPKWGGLFSVRIPCQPNVIAQICRSNSSETRPRLTPPEPKRPRSYRSRRSPPSQADASRSVSPCFGDGGYATTGRPSTDGRRRVPRA